MATDTSPSYEVRRHRTRRRASVRVNLRVGEQELATRTTDVSVGGLVIVSDRPLPMTKTCELVFTLRFNTAVECRIHAAAKVISNVYSADHRGFRCGLQFQDLASQALEAVSRYVSE